MILNNNFKLNIKTISSEDKISIDDIQFSGIQFIEIYIDETNILENDLFCGSFVYFKELKRSLDKSGKYLIFTSVTGVADEYGWDYVIVNHKKEDVEWKIEKDDIIIEYQFDKNDYIYEINKIEKIIEKNNENYVLEPINVIYPE